MSFVVIIPIKPLVAEKSRLRSEFSAANTAQLALAFAAATLAAICACAEGCELIVVTVDARVRLLAEHRGIRTILDPGGGLNAAVRAGIATARKNSLEALAVLPSDLPALTGSELAVALAAASEINLALVADATGTTLLTAGVGVPLEPGFGASSRPRQEMLGYRMLIMNRNSPLRLDVGTPADLATAFAVGVGPATSTCYRLLAARRKLARLGDESHILEVE
ncbi:MAG: 2-phospho-L-lactate guanylyltransferase [Microbacteriaceae bacterium]|nr:2-phospho-L-lactate guanylyltransferase [Microbacteriaceae bacterium]